MNTIFLGKGLEYSTDPEETHINNNIVVVGGSGSGKTVSVMEMKIIHNEGRSMIINVAKQNLISDYKYYLESKGYDVQVLNLADPESGTVCFDPLHFANDIYDTRDIQNLARAIVDGSGGHLNRDRYWPMSAVQLLMGEILYVLTVNRRATFKDVLNYHYDLRMIECGEDRGFVTNHDNDFAYLDPENPAIPCWETFRENATVTSRCILSSLNAPLSNMFPKEYQRCMRSKPQVDVLGLVRKPSVLFIYTSPVNSGLHALANLFISMAIKRLYEFAEKQEDGKLPIPIDLVFDDFACGSKVQNFPEMISIFREKGISTTLMLQSEAQLTGMYSAAEARTILDNCDTYLYMGGMNQESAERVARRCNLPSEKVLTLPVGKEILIRRGEKPRLADRYDIFNDTEYQIAHVLY